MTETAYTATRTGLWLPGTGTATGTATTEQTGTGTTGTDRTGSRSRSTDRTATETASDGTGTEPTETGKIGDPPSRSRSGSRRSDGTRTERDRAGAWLTGGGYLLLLTGVVAVVASIGQVIFAEQEKFTGYIVILGFDLTPYTSPAVFDLSVAALLHGGIRVARRAAMRRLAGQPAAGGSPWPWWIAAGAVGALSIWTNTLHQGSWITGPASAVLLLTWFLTLHSEYQELTAELRSEAKPKLIFSKLILIDRSLAKRAWVIAETRPMALGVKHRSTMGEEIGPRDLAILCGRLYRDVFADQHYKMLTKGIDGEGRIGIFNVTARREALRRATMTAEDAVDQYLGRPVIKREGIPIARVTYADVADTRQVLPPAEPAATPPPAEQPPATTPPAEPAATEQQPPAARPAPEPVASAPRASTDFVKVCAGIEGLPSIDPEEMCGCWRNGRGTECGWTFAEHIARKAEHVQVVLAAHPQWATQVERITKTDVKNATGSTASSVQNQVAWIFDQLRLNHQKQTTPV